MTATQWVQIAVVVAFTLVAAVWDYRTKKLPNWLTVPGFALALVFHIVTGAMQDGASGAGSGLLFALGGFATGFGILLVLWLIGGGGAGDVKLMGAIGAWLGATNTFYVFMVSAGFVAVGAIITLTWHMITRGMSRTHGRYLSTLDEKKLPTNEAARQAAQHEFKTRRRLMPYGVPVALATWTVLAWHAAQFVR